MEEYDEPEVELIAPEDFLARNPMPHDAQRMGFDHWSDQGAIIAMAAALNPAKPSHKAMAWVMLVVFTLPLVLTLAYELL
jgi:hypothetical protein